MSGFNKNPPEAPNKELRSDSKHKCCEHCTNKKLNEKIEYKHKEPLGNRISFWVIVAIDIIVVGLVALILMFPAESLPEFGPDQLQSISDAVEHPQENITLLYSISSIT